MGFANVASDGDSFFRSLNKQVGLTPHYYFIPTVYITSRWNVLCAWRSPSRALSLSVQMDT